MASLVSVLEKIDLAAIPLPDDKIRECKFFLSLAREEFDRDRFRWFISAFLNAAYSALEIKAKSLFFAYFDSDADEFHSDDEALAVLRQYVRAFQDRKRPSFVKTAAINEVLRKLYSHRNANSHDYALSITKRGENLPSDYCIGHIPGEGPPAIEFCEQVLEVFRTIEQEFEGAS